jgi:hypothetical protein
MNDFDKQRIENANWVLQMYFDKLEDTEAYIVVNGEYITVYDALKILDLAVYKLISQSEN